MVARFVVPRRLRDRMLAVLLSQKRFQRGRGKTIARRSYYQAARDFSRFNSALRTDHPFIKDLVFYFLLSQR
ncbi:MAG: hypothetical protein IPJ88_05640 [Myxococcales bacterium]|nr:MAG: hypothetical protein IPJ88_05640 [Myxococcales bacterium]